MPRETVVQAAESVHHEFLGEASNGVPAPSGFTEPQHGLSVGWNKIGWVQIHMFPHGWESTGDWTIVDLDRKAINTLIRALRKARDAAFGSDA